jgi:hypothetical protein
MGSVIAMAGDEIVMGEGAEMMIHDASGYSYGNAADMSEMADLLDRESNNVANIYARRAGGDAEAWRELMRAETWYWADEAVEAGLADRVQSDTPATQAKLGGQYDMRGVYQFTGRADCGAPRQASAISFPAKPGEEINQPKKEGAAMSVLIEGIRERLNLGPETEDEGLLLAALDERLNAAPALPEGVVTVEQQILDQLNQDAASGREAVARETAQRLSQLVDDAVRDGRIPPARREHWLNSLKTDEAGFAPVLAGLATGTVPLESAGYTGGIDEGAQDSAFESKLKSKLGWAEKEGKE